MHEDRYTAWRDTVVGDACVRIVKALVVVVAVVATVAVINRVAQGSTSRSLGIHSAGIDRQNAHHDGQFGRSGPDGGAMNSLSTKRGLAVACLAATALLSSCGGDDGPDLPPKPSATGEASNSADAPTPSDSTPSPTSPATSSAPPGGVDLDRAQRSAYEKALADHGSATKVLAGLNANPQPNQLTADRIKTVSYNPFSEEFFVEIQRYAKAGARVTGDLDVKWRRPVSVDLGAQRPTVVWEQCTTIGTTKVLIGDREIAQSGERKLGRITQYADENGFYRIGETEEVGPCA